MEDQYVSIEIPVRDADKYGADMRPESEAEADEEVNHG